MTLPYAEDGPGKTSDGEKAKAISNPFIIIAAGILVSLVEYCYIVSGLYWDPVIATIPLIAVLIPVGYYIDGKIQTISAGRKNDSIVLGTIVVILIISSRIIQVLDDYDLYPSKKLTFLLKMSLVILAVVLAFIWIHNRAQESVQPSEDSYNALLKSALAVIVVNVVVVAGCFILGTLYGGLTTLLLLVILGMAFISVWYFVGKMRSLGFVP